MSDIFICYSRTDSVIATRLVGRLRAEGWSVFMDVETHVGRRWHREIERELHTARAVVALWSALSRDSDFVLEEAEYGKRKDILFPAFIEAVISPYGFGRIQTADLIGWAGEPDHPGLVQLLASLRLHLQAAAPSQSPTQSFLPLTKGGEGGFQPLMPGQTFRNRLKIGGEGPLMVIIPAGRFLMGSPSDEPGRQDSEGPQHEIRIAQSFALSVYAVTFDDYDRYCDATEQAKPEDRGWGRGNRPVINVSWHDAQAYCAWLSAQTGRPYRLPREVEWEYACRAGTDTPFHFGKRISADQANFDLSRGQTVPVGTFPSNAFGLHEMHGNVWEWCQDTWHNNYQGAPIDDSAWEADEKTKFRVVRGGSWLNNLAYARVAARSCYIPGGRVVIIGFRVWCGFVAQIK
ncbi:MAG: SUMF1/EgtB/PvdO family nonheme iron enzyme [Phycisphaerales bacterium]|nr:SUMF1/EgtB/PvdO family nonheme iron enzyme [Phycisphaerales bacterium]